MQEIWLLLVGVVVLVLGWPIGVLLARLTKEELKDIQIYVKLIILISLLLGIVGLIVGNDWLLFAMLFIAIVSGGSLVRQKQIKKNKKE